MSFAALEGTLLLLDRLQQAAMATGGGGSSFQSCLRDCMAEAATWEADKAAGDAKKKWRGVTLHK